MAQGDGRNGRKVEAFMFGSVPLRTYLPDGDIDLSIFCKQAKGLQDTWGEKLYGALKKEVDNPKAKFKISWVMQINAEVKLLKCVVDDIVVDISFNSIGGLCTLNFLEAMDRKIGGKHLFKRSIILIKAWCYYESRVLGAQHSLLSTYALETMVLYIFNVHHDSLCSPLEVLQKFLTVFHKFKWGKYCLTLSGPVALSEFESNGTNVNPPEMQGVVLLTPNFMKLMLESYSYTPVMPTNTKGPAFPKCLNIMDPLLHSNNLGRSVSQTSEMRIKNAFGHVSQVLKNVINLYKHDAEASLEQLDQVFRNTWAAHRRPRGGMAGPEIGPRPGDIIPNRGSADTAVGNQPGFQGFQTALSAYGAQPSVGNTIASQMLPPPPPTPQRTASSTQSGQNEASQGVASVNPSNVSGNPVQPPPPPGPPPGPAAAQGSDPLSTAQPNLQLSASIDMIAHQAAVVATAQQHQAKGANSGVAMGSNVGDGRGIFDASTPGGGVPPSTTPRADSLVQQAEAGVGIDLLGVSSALQFAALQQWNALQQQQQQQQQQQLQQQDHHQPWLLQQCGLPAVQLYQVQNAVAAGLEAEGSAVPGSSAIKGSNRTTGRSDGQKGGLLRVRSSPDLGRPESGLSKKRDRNLNRRVHIPHPVPYPRAWASRPHEDLARAGLAPQKMQGSAQGKVPKSDGLLQALGRSSGRGALPPLPADGLSHTRVGGVAKVQHGAQRSKITLDPKVRARLEKMEREGKFAEFANEQMPTVNGRGRAGGHTHTSLDQAELESEEVAQSGEDDQAACEPPHSADSADGRSPQADVHPERGKEGTSDGNAAAPAPAPDFASQRERLRMQTMQGGLPPEAMQLGLPEMQPGVSGRAMQASGPQTPHLSHASVAMAPGDLVYPTMPHVYPVYMTQLGQVQLAGNHVFGMMPHPGSVQQPVGGPSVVAATSAVKPLPVMHVDQHAGLAESFYPQANVFPAVYYDQGQPGLSNGPLPSQLGFGTENVHLGMPGQGQASAQLGPLAVGPMASVQQSPASWAYVYPSTTQVASQRSSTDRFSDSSSSGDDVLSGDIETLTQHLEMARNLVGRKQAERERPPVANKTTATSYPRPARAEGPPAGTQGHNRKRQNQHVEEGPRTAYPPRTPPHRSDQHGGRDRPRDQTGAPAAQRSFQQSFQGGNFGHMMAYQQPFAPPPPPPQAGVSEPPAGVPVQGAEDVLFQVPANVAGHPAGGYIVRSPAGTAMVGNGPVVSPPYTALPTGPSLAGVASVEDAGGTGSREGHSTRAANWHFEDIASHTKPVALSTDDGKFVEIDPSVIRAVEAALAGMMSLGEVAQGQNMGGESRGPREENKDPPTDCSPRDRHGEPSTAAGRRMDAGAKRGRRPEAGMEGGLQRPHTAEATAALMQQNPAMFSAVNPAVNSALAFLAGAGARASHGAMAPEAGQRMGAPLHPDSFLVSRGMASYGTGSFIPALPQDDNRAATSGGEAHVAAGRGAESDPRAAPDALGELEGSNDGSWTTSSSVSLNTGSDRGDMDHKPHHRKNGRGGGPRPWQDHAEYGRRGPRAHHPAQQPYGWHDGQWQQGMERGGGMREVGEFYEYGHPTGGFFYSDARAQGYCAFGPGYPCPEREYDSMWYEYNGRPKGYRPGGGGHVYGWRGGARRGEREDLDRDGRWAMHGWPNRGDRHQMDGCSTPDNSNGHGAGRARGGSFQRRGNERWGGIREPADGPNFRQSRYAKQGTGYYEGTHTYWPRRVGRGGRRSDGADDGMGRRYPRGAPEQGQEEPQQAVLGAPGRPLPVDQPAERHMPGTPQRGSDPSGRKTPLGGFVMNGNGSPGADQERARSFTLNSEDFPALETATPQAGTSPPQLKSPRQAAMPGGGINPSIR